ncbi:MAG: glycosyltransferase family 2 protein, partial [Pseudonocardia sp.]|nr:glycosyltransferase family 2 protein [Pseudonocardia sp.]
MSAVSTPRPAPTPGVVPGASPRPGHQPGQYQPGRHQPGQYPQPGQGPGQFGTRPPLRPVPPPELARRPRPRPAPRRSANPAVTVIVPTRNEARNLEVVLPAIAAVRPAVHEVIVVDGNSTDDTLGTARRTLPWARCITQTRKGKGNAMACGFAAATGDVVVMFDADGSADPGEIPAFVSALISGADFAKGSRFARGGGSEDITLL